MVHSILGIKTGHHDPGAAVVCADGRVCAISEERLNRVKHAKFMFPRLAIDYVLQHFGFSATDIDCIAIDRVAVHDVEGDFVRHARADLQKIPRLLVNHHMSHAASAAYCSGFTEGLVIVVDGSGEGWRKSEKVFSSESVSVYDFRNGTLTEIDKILHDRDTKNGRYIASMGIGKFYARMTHYLGFGEYQDGKTMGLAPYGANGAGDADVMSWLRRFPWAQQAGGRVYCNHVLYPGAHGFVSRCVGRLRYWYYTMRTALHRSCSGEMKFPRPVYLHRPARRRDLPLPDAYYTAVAAHTQQLLERVLVETVRHYKERTGHVNLCLAGGVALNIDANSRILEEVGFKRLFIQPASSDTGIPLGNALLGFHQAQSYDPARFRMDHAYLGRPYTDAECEAALVASGLPYERADDVQEIAAHYLAANKIVGWFQGESEYGPRALGNRSILMSPIGKENKDILNHRVKKREAFRPFAPICCREYAQEYFSMATEESKFMLLLARVKDAYADRLPAITHVDQTARVQTLDRRDNPITYDLIRRFGEKTGLYVLLNTSFNIAGEPIVESPADAVAGFQKCDLDCLVIGPFVCRKPGI